jgi:hypothetical protein
MHVAWNWTSWILKQEDVGDVTETKILIVIGICLFKIDCYRHMFIENRLLSAYIYLK